MTVTGIVFHGLFGFLSHLNIQVFLTPFYQYVLIFLVPEKYL